MRTSHPPQHHRRVFRAAVIGVCLAVMPLALTAQEHEHLTLGSSEPDGGQLILSDWDFEQQKVRAFLSFCSSSICLFSTINPAFLGATAGAMGHDSTAYPLVDGTIVSLEVIARDAAVTLRIDGANLDVGSKAVLGVSPHIHNHPSWQLLLPPDTDGDFTVSYKLSTESEFYTDSPFYTSILTSVRPEPTATATATATPESVAPCAGDCDGDGDVTVDELIRGITIALTGEGFAACPAMDSDDDGAIRVDDLVRAINAALVGCATAPTPTPTPTPVNVTFAELQKQIFSPACSLPTCHVGPFGAGNLILEAGVSYSALVGVAPDIFAASSAGHLRVDPGNPDNSFLLIKLLGPPLSMGSRMPLTGPPLSAASIEAVRAWILAGAPE